MRAKESVTAKGSSSRNQPILPRNTTFTFQKIHKPKLGIIWSLQLLYKLKTHILFLFFCLEKMLQGLKGGGEAPSNDASLQLVSHPFPPICVYYFPSVEDNGFYNKKMVLAAIKC